MPAFEAPCVELGNAPQTPSIAASPSPSEISSASSPEPTNVRATPLFRALAMPPPEPEQPQGQEELERRLPGYRRIVIPRELTLIELLKQCSGVITDEEVLRIREAKLRVVAERVGLRRLNVLAPNLRKLVLDGSALTSLRDIGVGLAHLKVLSINKCGLNSLDGLWGLSALRELHAAGNRLQDLQLLPALQKLHTLNLADNPSLESDRLWTLGVCGALRRLFLNGTPASDLPDYRRRVASALPMLVYLDDRPLHTDIDYDSDGVFGAPSSSSDSEAEGDLNLPNITDPPPAEPQPGSSTNQQEMLDQGPEGDAGSPENKGNFRRLQSLRRRPATTENAGSRPAKPAMARRPRTANARPIVDEPTRLQILSTLMDDDWLGGGSKLTSHGAVCGNLARALRGTTKMYHQQTKEAEKELVEQTMGDVSRMLAAEIPRLPRLEDWIKFKEETGIEIDIDFNERPACPDPSKILERLEQIEADTRRRFDEEKKGKNTNFDTQFNYNAFSTSSYAYDRMGDYFLDDIPLASDSDIFLNNEVHSVSSETVLYPGDNDPQTD